MNKIVLLLLVSSIALLTEGCSYLSDFAELGKEAGVDEGETAGISVNSTDDTEALGEEEETAGTSDKQEVAGLIPTTNPDARVKSIIRGRQDPFAAISISPQIEIEEEDNSDIALPQRVTSTPTFAPPKEEFFDSSDEEFFEPPEEEFLEPSLAREVVITGVVQLNGKNKIIVNAPEESSSRYVEVGQYISNGQILVKSINFNNYPAPLVILEQFGVEVTKEIGEAADA